MGNPLISVVVPVYKTEPYLKQCVDSILKQTYSNFEVILVDDGSPDNAGLVCDTLASQDARIRVIHQENGGLVSARKAGTLEATGDYITHVDSDDWLLPDHLQAFADAIEQHGADVITSIYHVRHEEGGGESVFGHDLLKAGYYDRNRMESVLFPVMLSAPKQNTYTFGVLPSVWTKCVKRELAHKNTMEIPNGITMGEDVAWTYPCIYEASSIELLEAKTYVYRVNLASMTHTYSPKLDGQMKTLVDYLRLRFKDSDVLIPQLGRYARMLESISITNLMRYDGTDYAAVHQSMQHFFLDKTVRQLTKGTLYSKRERLIKWAVIQPFSFPLSLLCKRWAKKGKV